MKRLLILSTLFAGCAHAVVDADLDGDPVELSPSAVSQIEALLAQKHARTAVERKLGSQLLYARAGQLVPPEGKPGSDDGFTSLVQREGSVLVDVSGATRAMIEAHGGTVVYSARGQTRAWIELARVEELAGEPAVRAVRPALAAITHRTDPPAGGAKFIAKSRAERVAAMQTALAVNLGSVVSSGSKAHAVDRARKWFNATGAGVSVGVLSDSDDFKEAAIASGDLPDDTVTLEGQSGRPGSGEGTAMMEIVHDLAPDAKLYFATAFNGAQSFADNIRALRFVHHCDVIVDDVMYFAEHPYQDDIIAAAVQDVTADGAIYVSSAGNDGNFDDGTSGTWEGDFRAGGELATLPSGYVVHDFGSKVISDRIEKRGGPVVLHWSDPSTIDAPAATNDYDLFLLDQDLRNVVLASTDIQDATTPGLPFEYLGYVIPANYRVVIAHHPDAQARAVHLQVFGGELGIGTAGAIYGHTAAQDAISVAAVDAAEANGGEFVAGPTTPVELFSSDGNRRIFYDRFGAMQGTGPLLASSGGLTRKKPDLAGADGVATTLPSDSGLNPFFGTSAAAPHVAAIAALMKSAAPTATTLKIRDSLRLGALDIEASGVDRDAGSGIAHAMNALTRVGAAKAVFLEIASVGITPSTSDAVIPGGGGQLSIPLANNGGAGATSVKATLSSSSPYITVTQPLVTYGSIASGATGNGTSQFAFTVSPGAPCGAQLPMQLAVNFTGLGTHPTLLDFTVRLGRPGAPVAFTYTGAAVAIPDNSVAGVDVSLPVALGSPLSRLAFRFDGSACTPNAQATTVGLEHSWIGDVVVTLISPAGTRVTLANQPGGALNGGNNMCQTILDDAATASIQAITSTGAPYTGSWKPANPLAAFLGESADGTWRLNVSDRFASDTGNVRAFTLQASGYSCTP